MIGTTFRLGFDGSAVNRGIGGIGSLMGRLTRQMGIGAARNIGYGVSDMLGRIVTAIPNAIRELSNWGSEMSDLEVQTGIGTQALMELSEALRMAGATPSDIGRTLSQFANTLYQVSQGQNDGARESLKKLGFTAQELADIPLDEAFHKIGKAIADSEDEIKGLEGVMSSLFGGGRGMKMLRFFKDYEANMEKMRRSTAQWSDVNGDVFGDLDDISDALGRWEMVRRRIALGLLSGLGGGSAGGFSETINNVFDWLSKIGPLLEQAGASLRSFLGTAIEVIANDGLLSAWGGLLTNMGKKIGIGIAQGIADGIGEMPGKFDMLKGFLFGGRSSGGSTASTNPEAVMRDQLRVLHRIERNVGIAKFA
jgi:hypothetical protein